MATKPEAKNLPCIFNSIVSKYPESQLAQCEIKEKQRWRHALAETAINKITILAKYFPELNSLLDSLESYSLCEKHYNQVVAKDSFINQLKKANNLIFLDPKENERKRIKLNNDTCDFGIQVSLPDPEYEKQINELGQLNMQLLSENKILEKELILLNSKYESQINELKHFNN